MQTLGKLRFEVCEASKDLFRYGLVILTWGNVSAISRDRKYVLIKPSGIPYKDLTPEKMVLVDMNGKVYGSLNPSSDLHTHIELYHNLPDINAVVHTHSRYATAFAQAKKPIMPLGTTHADYFYGEIPVTRDMLKKEIEKDYELNTGKVIVETFIEKRISPMDVPACLVASHGLFTWGRSCKEAIHNSVIIEQIAEMNLRSYMINHKVNNIDTLLLDKHYFRKHGKNAYYGQKKVN